MSYSSGKAIPRLCAGLAFASVMSIPTAAMAAGIEEVVVTAQRTEESLQEVPVAVSAFSGEMMEDKQILSPSDLQLNTPNVSFTATNFGGSSFAIRGIGRNVIAGSGEDGVSIHLDQIAIPTNLPAAEFYDMERVEVLRGPQGTLYGKNATGGTVNMVTIHPDYESVNGYWDAEAGDYSNKRLKGALNIPITDNFAVRAAGMWLERDGYIENTAYGAEGDCVIPGTTYAEGVITNEDGSLSAAPGTTQPCSLSGIDDDIDGRDIWTYRVTAAWQISDAADAWLQYNRFKEDDDKVRISNQICERNNLPNVGCTPDGFGFDTPHNGSTTGGLFGGLNEAVLLGTPAPVSAFQRTGGGFREQFTDFEPIYQYDQDIWTAGFDYDFDQYKVGVLAGYSETDYMSRQDYLMDVGNNLYATDANPSGLWPTSAPARDEAGGDWTSSECNFNDGTAGIFGGCVMPVDQTRVFAFDQSDAHTEYWTAEVKLASDYDGRFNFIVGAGYAEGEGYGDYYVNANTLDLVGLYGVPRLGFPPLYPTMFDSTSNPSGNGGGTSESQSIFGEVYFDITDTLKLTAGLRYNDDIKEVQDTGILYNAVNLNALLGGALGPDPFWTRTTGFMFGAPYGDLELLYVDQAQLDAAALTPILSPERFAVSALVPLVPDFNEVRTLTGSPDDVDFQETTGRIGLDWQVNDETMVYGFYTRGYKPGGLNPPQNATLATETVKYIFEEETVDSIEIGAKNTFLDGTLVFNATAFMYDYGGYQTTRIRNNNSINDNIDAEIMGLELDVFWQPESVPGLAIDAAYAYLNAEVDGSTSLDPLNRTGGNPDFVTLKNMDPGSATGVNYIARINGEGAITDAIITAAYAGCGALSDLNPNTDCPAVLAGTTQTVAGLAQPLPTYFSRNFLTAAGVEVSDGLNTNLDGNQLPQSPENTIHIGVAYTWQIEQIGGALTGRWDWSWRDEQYAREFNTKGDEIDAWDQHNASLIYESSDGVWEGRLWVRNVADDDNITGKYLTSDTSGFFRNYFLTEPRIYGASVKYNFGGDL
jgi:iron complex outermembrane receptor protein